MKKGVGIAVSVFGLIFGLIGIFVGAIFVVISHFMYEGVETYNATFQEFAVDAATCTGVIVSSYDGSTIIRYTAEDGNDYEKSFSMSSSDLRSGTKVKVYYDANEPYLCMVPEVECGVLDSISTVFKYVGWGVIAFFGGIGLILIIVGIVTASSKKISKEEASAAGINIKSTVSVNTTQTAQVESEAGSDTSGTEFRNMSSDTTQSNYSGVDKNLL